MKSLNDSFEDENRFDDKMGLSSKETVINVPLQRSYSMVSHTKRADWHQWP